LVKKYSEFINYPINLYLSKDVREIVEVDDEEDPLKIVEVNEDGVEITDEDEDVEKKPKETKEVTK
jgi:HSP90 family molecular chaperone